MDPHILLRIHVYPRYVFRHRVFGKYWNYLDLLRFPQIPMIFDVDFPVDFSRKKIPDDVSL